MRHGRSIILDLADLRQSMMMFLLLQSNYLFVTFCKGPVAPSSEDVVITPSTKVRKQSAVSHAIRNCILCGIKSAS